MFKKLYPADQLEKYFLLDIIVLLALIYQVVNVSTIHMAGKVMFIILFLAAYYVCLWLRDWRLLVASYMGYVLLVVLAQHGGGWMLLYGFIFANLLGRANRKILIGAGMAGIALTFILFGWIDEGSPFAVFTSLQFPIMIGQLVMPIIVYTRQKANVLKEKLDTANEQLERYIQEEERNRIARDLHDTLGQTLTMIKMKSELAIRLVDKRPDQTKHELNDILSSSRYALKQMGELVSDLKHVSLEEEIERSQEILSKAGIALEVTYEKSVPLLSRVAETMLALSIREAVTNVMKHSEADIFTIVINEEEEHYVVRTSDNGNGNLKQGEGNGLQSMKERMAILGGKTEMSSIPGHGTSLTFHVPLASNRRVSQT